MTLKGDIADQADGYVDALVQEQRDRISQKLIPPKDWDGETCYNCGNDYDERRRNNGYWTCVSCQEKFEKRMKGY